MNKVEIWKNLCLIEIRLMCPKMRMLIRTVTISSKMNKMTKRMIRKKKKLLKDKAKSHQQLANLKFSQFRMKFQYQKFKKKLKVSIMSKMDLQDKVLHDFLNSHIYLSRKIFQLFRIK